MLACLVASQLLSASSSPGGNSARSADQTASAKSAKRNQVSLVPARISHGTRVFRAYVDEHGISLGRVMFDVLTEQL